MKSKTFRFVFLLLQIATVTVFAGRAWQHLFWDAPYRVLLWDAHLMSGLVERFSSMSWGEFVASPSVDAAIQESIFITGIFYLLCALAAIFLKKIPFISSVFLLLGSTGLVVLAGLCLKEKFYHFGQFFEYSLQFSSPLFLFFVFRQKKISTRLVFWMKMATAATFICHGLYAVGYYPRPGNFVEMTINILGVSEANAIRFLMLAGFFDFLVGIGIFLPKKVAIPFLAYATIWGLATAVARVWANLYPGFVLESLHQWLFETVYRLPQFFIPLAILVLCKYHFSLEKKALSHRSLNHV